jgi:putative ABC transport system permease protein
LIFISNPLENFLRDIRTSLRSLVRQPSFTSVAVITLAIGIGACSAVFSVIQSVLIAPLPYDHSEQLVMMSESGDDVEHRMVSYQNFVDWRDRNQVFESISTIRDFELSITEGAEPQPVTTKIVAAGYFRVLHLTPLIGRDFTLDDERTRSRVAIISNSFWQSRFGGDPDVVGRSIDLDRLAFTIVGVMPDTTHSAAGTPIWLLIGGDWGYFNWGRDHRDERTAGYVIGRLKPEVTIQQARENMAAVSSRLAREFPVHNAGANRVDMVSLRESLTGQVRTALLFLMAAVALVLLIACANVANLLLARSLSRRREIAIHAALGAGRGRIIRNALSESLLLAAAAACCGLLIAYSLIRLYNALNYRVEPVGGNPRVNLLVITFAISISMLTGLLSGLSSAWNGSRVDLYLLTKQGAGDVRAGRLSLRGSLVIAEIAMAVVLLTGAGLLAKSFRRLIESPLGFDPHNTIAVDLNLPYGKYESREGRSAFYRQVLERVSALPGVQSVSLSSEHPGLADGMQTDIYPEGHPPIRRGDLINVDWSPVTEDFFNTMQIQILRGRPFTRQEVDLGSPVVLIDETLANRFWPRTDPVGKWIKYDSPDKHEVIGVVREVTHYGSEMHPLIKIYTPFGRATLLRSVLFVRAAGIELRSLTAAISREVKACDQDVVAARAVPIQELLAEVAAPMKFNMILLGIFSVLAVALAISGLYGFIAYLVTGRTHEIGIRMAIGASRRNILGLVALQSLKFILVGMACGAVVSMALARLMKSLLFGINPTDPLTLLLTCSLLGVVALLACLVPALKAIKIDPTTALRYE